MRSICRRIVCAVLAAALLCACGVPAFAVNEYMQNAHWKPVTGTEATEKLRNGDAFVLDCYRATCGNSKYVGAYVLMDWMDTYGKDVYGVDVDAKDGVPSFVWEALGKTSATLPFVAFVRDGNVQAFSPEGDMDVFTEKINDAFFAFYTDVTRVSLNILTMPDKTVYNTGEALDTTGMTLEAVRPDGSRETVTEGFTCTGFSSDTPGHRTVTVSYDSLETTFTAAVNTPNGKPYVWVVQPARSKLRYGYRTRLTADWCNMSQDVRVEWSYRVRTIRGVETKTETGTDVVLTAEGFTQNVTVTGIAVDANGDPIRNANGEAVTLQHTIRFQNNVFYRLQYFFEKLFDRDGCGSEI